MGWLPSFVARSARQGRPRLILQGCFAVTDACAHLPLPSAGVCQNYEWMPSALSGGVLLTPSGEASSLFKKSPLWDLRLPGKQERWFCSAGDCHSVSAQQAAQELTRSRNVHLTGARAAEVSPTDTAESKKWDCKFFPSFSSSDWADVTVDMYIQGWFAGVPMYHWGCVFSWFTCICDLWELNAELASDRSSKAFCLLYSHSLSFLLSRDKLQSLPKSS